MFAPLFFLAHSLAPAHVAPADVIPLVMEVVEVASSEPPLAVDEIDPLGARVRTARILLVMAIFESAGRTRALGDGGRSCGVLQQQPYWTGTTCDALRADRRYALRSGLAVMRDAVARCGSIRAGLGLYAGGKCGARPDLVKLRCTIAQAC